MEKKQNNSLFADVKWLLLKILLLGIIFAVVWIFLLGICRNGDESMNPAIRAGDLVIYDRLTQEYHTGDVVVIKQDGGRQIRRVAAVSGDVVDVTEEGLNVNGYQQQEADIYTETLPYKGIHRIAEGQVDYKIPLKGLKGEQKDIAESINRIGDGLDAAVEAGMKNERLKTDLITNVSHDIKTPLTSIINYIDLMKRENIQDPKIQSYLEVLEAKAQRLKTLTEDVVEASKVSSGNVVLNCMKLNLTEMIQQTSGEFVEKFEKRDLKEILNLPEEPAYVWADGRRTWRILENIYNNAAKYALEGSRIYADLKLTETEVVFSLKNVSEQPLNISADELTERFIRGDVSRSTEGSGLGLSIARDLAKLMNAKFELYLDGDLFRVTITFARIND